MTRQLLEEKMNFYCCRWRKERVSEEMPRRENEFLLLQIDALNSVSFRLEEKMNFYCCRSAFAALVRCLLEEKMNFYCCRFLLLCAVFPPRRENEFLLLQIIEGRSPAGNPRRENEFLLLQMAATQAAVYEPRRENEFLLLQMLI